MRLTFSSPLSIARRQAVCVGLAAIIAAFFWGNGQQMNLSTILLYSIIIGNIIMPVVEALRFVYWKRPFPYNWLFFLLVVIGVLGPVYAISTIVVWWFAPPFPQTLIHLLTTGWKLPVVVTFIFSVLNYLYNITREQLERRNRELQQSVQQGAAQIEQQVLELARAREIQRSLLPREIPQLAGFEVASAWRPAQAVSGDYYDVVKLDDRRLGVCIADVVGKGVSAALMMANVQAAVRAFGGSAESPSQLCAKVNHLLCENLATGKFVTFLYGVLDSGKRTLEYCNAGHLPPVLISGGRSRFLSESGAVLGVFPHWQYQDSTVELRTGDRLLMFTDGITEAADELEQEFGEEKLAEAACRYSERPAAELSELVLKTVSSFCGAQFQDDATLMVIAAK